MFPRPPAVKAFIKAFLPALLILGAVVFAVIRYGDQRAEVATLDALQEEERQAAASMSRIVQQALLNTTASLEYMVLLIERQLAELAPVEDVAQVLLDFSKTHPVFDQLRYLDMEGQEVVRVDAEVDGSRITPPEGLQDKSSRDYFQRARKLERGKVIILPVEFNSERGVVEYPLNPVIRVAMPVFDGNSAKVGVAIINYKARALLDQLFAAGKVARGNPNILSLQGRWLMETKGFQPQTYTINPVGQMSFSQRLPSEWQMIGERTAGVFRTDNGLFSYRVLLPSQLDSTSAINRASWTVPRQGGSGEGGWIVLSQVPLEQLSRILAANQRLPQSMKALLGVMVFMSAWLFALQFSANRLRLNALESAARSDVLTGLVNRGEFDRNLARAISLAQRTNRPMGVLYIDVNEFKALNDTHGHASGDRVLKAIGDRLVKSCRSSDVAARLGGDEFAVILTELTGRPDARAAVRSIATKMQEPLSLDHGEYQTSVSIGVALYPDDGISADALLAHADQQMYAEKGRSRRGADSGAQPA
ncbi:diguanylate cyclase [gamma proteobacterium NOR5-3]|nr:diguanylate cyclase [gamma proteobacterium NOR5-3]